MILYHGSFLEIAQPDLVHSRPNVDFGRGFYVTPLYEQAAKWCGKFKRRGKDGIISKYEYDEIREAELKVLKFDAYSEEWLDFILNCRSGKDTTDYDLVLGGVANDKVFNTVELFFDGLIDSKIRNEAFAHAFAYMNLIEHWGSGIPRIIDKVKAVGLQEPEFIGGEVDLRINIYRGQIDANNAMISANGIKNGANGVDCGVNDGINGDEVPFNKEQTQLEKLLQIIKKNPSATQAYYRLKIAEEIPFS